MAKERTATQEALREKDPATDPADTESKIRVNALRKLIEGQTYFDRKEK